MSSQVSPSPRLASLDQFRGYTIAGMCMANFLAPFSAIHSIFKHNDTYFSYADTIMPGFLFIVGFAFRLTYLKRAPDKRARVDGRRLRAPQRQVIAALAVDLPLHRRHSALVPD